MLAGLRSRILRPWTFMMVQKEHAKGQPREVSAVPNEGLAKWRIVLGLIRGSGALPISTRLWRSWANEYMGFNRAWSASARISAQFSSTSPDTIEMDSC